MNIDKWEARYSSKTVNDLPEPAELLSNNARLLSGGKALDIAMGMGQNALYLAAMGYETTGVDRAAHAVALANRAAETKGVQITAVKQDILAFTIKENHYDLIANFNFLEREIIPGIKNGLKKGGLVFFESYTIELLKKEPGRTPGFLLQQNELLTFFLDFFIIFYHETTQKDYPSASLIAMKL